MANGRPSSDPADPLLGYSALSLFPRTVRDSSAVSKPSGQDNIESFHSYLKSMELRSPTKLREQAKCILDGGSEILNPNFQNNIVSTDKSGSISEKRVENPPERRPAFGRKRAQFSLKPDSSSQPTVVMEPSLDIDKLQDPEEYFLAHEKLENAKQELQRQQGGVLVDLNQRIPSTTARHRRPGILGRSVSYKHHYSSSVSYNDENTKPCPATVGQEILSTDCSSQAELVDPNVASRERELTEMVVPNFESQERDFTVTKAVNKVDEILDELLSGTCEDLDGDGALPFLQERLQIKPIDLDKLSLPELNDVQQNDFKSTGGNRHRYRDSLSDINAMLKGFSSKTPIKNGQLAESSVLPSTSPTPPKSPFASVTLLKKHILQSSLTMDPYSVLKVNLSPVRNSSTLKCSGKQFDNIANGKELSFSKKLKSVILETDDIAVANNGSHEVVDAISGDSAPPSKIAVNNNSRRLLQESPARSSSSVKYSDGQSDKIENVNELSFSERLKSVTFKGDGISVASKDSHEVVDVITRDLTPSKKVVNNNSRRLLRISPARKSSVSEKHSDKIENGKELSFPEKLKSVILEGDSTLPSEKAVNNQSDKIENGKELSFSEKLELVMLEGDDMAGANNSPHEVVDVMIGDSTPPSAKAVNNSSRRRRQVSPATKFSSVKCSDKQSDKIENRNQLSFSENLKSVMLEGDNISVANKSPHEVVDVIIGDSTPAKAVNDSSRRSLQVSPARKFSSSKCRDKRSNKIKNRKELSFSKKLKSVMLEGDDTAVACNGPHEVVDVITRDSNLPSEKAVTNNSRGLGAGTNSGLSGSHSNLDGNIRASNVDDDLRRLNADTDFQISGTNELEDKFEDMLQEAEPHAHPDQNIDDSTLETLNISEIQGDQPTTGIVDDHEREGPSKTLDNDPEQCTEKILEPSDKSLDKRSKEKTPPRRGCKRKEISGRHSLAGAGTLWNSGVRRSTRIRMRPLEYWKGERFLYGRIHESLTTVIGVKYMSPGKDGEEAKVRVKSYVSDKYKELVDLAALH